MNRLSNLTFKPRIGNQEKLNAEDITALMLELDGWQVIEENGG